MAAAWRDANIIAIKNRLSFICCSTSHCSTGTDPNVGHLHSHSCSRHRPHTYTSFVKKRKSKRQWVKLSGTFCALLVDDLSWKGVNTGSLRGHGRVYHSP